MSRPSGKADLPELSRGDLLESGLALTSFAAPGVVNRTHRILRERALRLEARRSRLRSLLIPLAVSTFFFAAVVFAVWSALGQSELTLDAVQEALPDSSQQIMVLLMWCLPLSLVVLAVVWMTRSGSRGDGSGR